MAGPLATTLNRLYPPTCVLCGAAGQAGLDLCPGCLADLPRNDRCCFRCALPLASGPGSAPLCGECLRHPPPFARCWAALRYEEPVPALVGGAKFQGRLNFARLLGLILARYLQSRGAEIPEVIIPVPLHRARLRERGYNQALEIARATAQTLSVPIVPHACTRTLTTAPQAGLEKRERQRNVRGAFRVARPPQASHVAILDDVVTTGSTAAELTKALREQGVDRVDLWAAARTP